LISGLVVSASLPANANAQFTLTITEAGTGTGTETTNTGTITWSGNTGTVSYDSGTSVTLTATANSGSTFTGWSGACSGQSASATCVITMNSAEAVTANYVLSGTTPFSDVPSSSQYASFIEAIDNNGITTGCGTGDVYECSGLNATIDYVTRDQMAAFLVRGTQVATGQGPETYSCTGLGVGVAGASVPCENTTPYFSDVSTANQYFPYIQKLYELGITTGCVPNVDYECPGLDATIDYVTRDQMAAFLVRGTQVATGQGPEAFTCNGGTAGASVPCADTTPYFLDVSTTNNPYFQYIQKLYELEITTGCGTGGDYECPGLAAATDYVTRDQMAAFLARAFLGMELPNFVGTWNFTDVSDLVDCGLGTKTDTYTATVTQNGNEVTLDLLGNSLTSIVKGNVFTATGGKSIPYDGGTLTLTSGQLTFSSDENSFSGTFLWSWTNGTKSCTGSTQSTGQRS